MGVTEDKTYGGVNLPTELINQIDNAIQSNGYGFRSRAEFVTYCIRKELDSLKLKREGKNNE